MPEKSLRTPAVLLACVTWGAVLALTAGTGSFDRLGIVEGMDYLQFYAAGAFAAAGRMYELYDWPTFAAELPKLAPGIGELLYLPVYPPIVALVFAPLSGLPYATSLAIWTLITIGTYGAAVTALVRRLPALRAQAGDIAWLAAGFPPFVLLVMYGQVSALWLAAVAAGVVAWLAGRPFLAGAALGLLSLKPPFFAAAVVALVVVREWRVLAGISMTGLLLAGATWAWVGTDVLVLYASRLLDVASAPERFEPRVWQMHSLQPFFVLLFGRSAWTTALYAAAATGVLVLLWQVWRRVGDPRLRLAGFIIAVVLLNPHLYVYDLVVLAPALMLVGDALPDLAHHLRRRQREFIHAVFVAALLGPLAALTHVQLTPLVLIGLLASLEE